MQNLSLHVLKSEHCLAVEWIENVLRAYALKIEIRFG